MTEAGSAGIAKEALGAGLSTESVGNEYASKLETIRSSFEGSGSKAKESKSHSPEQEKGDANENEEGFGVEIDIDEGIYGNRGFDKFIDEERQEEGQEDGGEKEDDEDEQEDQSSETQLLETLEKNRKANINSLYEQAPIRHPARA